VFGPLHVMISAIKSLILHPCRWYNVLEIMLKVLEWTVINF